MKLFISYRRADSQHITDRIHDHMVNHFGYDNVFQDVDTIPLGVDFRQYLADAVENCDAVLVVIGPDWARIMREREREAADFVRIEVESALRLGKLMIPVLVNQATMPNPGDLPETVRELCYRNAARVRPNPDFRRDCTVIAENITRLGSFSNAVSPVREVSPAKPSPPKLKSRVPEILPQPFEWCEIPAGEVTLKEGGYVPNGGATYHVERFWIAKYLVTNAHFKKFIEMDSYQNQDWWTTIGWHTKTREKWTEPSSWQYKGWNGRDYPVAGVSWFEALAFCKWLSAVVGENILLPTEQQWQRAAQGDDGRRYPWGNVWDSAKCNTKESGIGTITPVTRYPSGASPYGVMDMAGNVREWCLSEFANSRIELESGANRVWRGGYYHGSQSSAAVLSRNTRDDTAFRLGVIGFRVVLVAP